MNENGNAASRTPMRIAPVSGCASAYRCARSARLRPCPARLRRRRERADAATARAPPGIGRVSWKATSKIDARRHARRLVTLIDERPATPESSASRSADTSRQRRMLWRRVQSLHLRLLRRGEGTLRGSACGLARAQSGMQSSGASRLTPCVGYCRPWNRGERRVRFRPHAARPRFMTSQPIGDAAVAALGRELSRVRACTAERAADPALARASSDSPTGRCAGCARRTRISKHRRAMRPR